MILGGGAPVPVVTQRKSYSIERRAKSGGAADIASAADILFAIDELRQEIAVIASTPTARRDGDVMSAEADQELRIELAQMVKMIARAKSEIASIKHPKANDDFMIEASNELDAIVAATEGATNTILEAVENIETKLEIQKAEHGDDETIMLMADQISSEIVKIFEACNFQDITGQRITKVVRTLRFIETRILAMIEIWGKEAFEDLPVPGGPEAHSSDDLVSGPQLENQGISQAEIDALFD